MPNFMILPSFKEAQQLYAIYSTIENNYILNDRLNELLDNSFLSSLTEKNVHAIYNDIIMKYYPNEICIKANFINQILMNDKRHVTIFELPIGSSRADLCKINGTSVVYEIKTDLDNFNRLKKQLKDYYDIFEEVYIICSEAKANSVLSFIPDTCGIYTYRQTKSGRYIFKLYRTAEKDCKTNPEKQLRILRKNEFYNFFKLDSSITKKNDLIELTNQKYNSESINHTFKKILKIRFSKQWSFLKQHHSNIYEIDYQWFYKNQIEPYRIYK